MNRKAWLVRAKEVLDQAGIDDGGWDAWLMLSSVCGIDRTAYSLEPLKELAWEAYDRLEALLARRVEHIPVQQLLGTGAFYGRDFYVAPEVLIPRQDTEVLVETVLGLMAKTPELSGPDVGVLDVCTGSGCILFTLLLELGRGRGMGCDLSKEALHIAEINRQRFQLPAKLVESDLFDRVEGSFDVIVSNPPYIPHEVIPTLAPEVRDHEPMLALDGGSDGLVIYRRLIPGAWKQLTKGGLLALEIGYDQGAAVTALMEEAGFTEVCCTRDLAGLDRVVTGWKR